MHLRQERMFSFTASSVAVLVARPPRHLTQGSIGAAPHPNRESIRSALGGQVRVPRQKEKDHDQIARKIEKEDEKHKTTTDGMRFEEKMGEKRGEPEAGRENHSERFTTYAKAGMTRLEGASWTWGTTTSRLGSSWIPSWWRREKEGIERFRKTGARDCISGGEARRGRVGNTLKAKLVSVSNGTEERRRCDVERWPKN